MEQTLAWSPTRDGEEQAVRQGVWKLPPLILHPFTSEKGPDRLLEGSRAQMILNGVFPEVEHDREKLMHSVLAGKYQELKMLIYIGRDLQRWAEQCLDFATRQPNLRSQPLKQQSFVTLIVESPPAALVTKLKSWGIHDPKSIFSRAAGLNSMFDHPPPQEILCSNFLETYQRFADYLFMCYKTMHPYEKISSNDFAVELFASEEYASFLAEGWKN